MLFSRRLAPVLLVGATLLCAVFFAAPKKDRGVPVPPDLPQTVRRVLLVPLDSRPPCGRFVQDAARIAGVEVVLPPAELLDEYFRPGDTSSFPAATRPSCPLISSCTAAFWRPGR